MAEDWTTKKVDKYVLVNKKLGSGAYGVVYRGFLSGDQQQQVAVKTIPIKVISDTPKMLELIKREIAILQKINHPNIVKLHDVSRTSNYLYMFLEYCCDGDLQEYMNKKEEKRLSELEAVIFLKHIVEGFKKLYQEKIIHRDIKPANILLKNGVAKITDFGFARVIETEMNDPAYLSRLGSPLYMAPQILEGQPFSAKCDIWSVGIMFYQLLYGKTPWMAENAVQLFDNIKSQPLKFPPKPVRSQKVKELIVKMLQFQEKQRISWEEIFKDPTITVDEQRIKSNMQQLLAEKNEISKSISLNRLYIEQNLVIGYLANNPINTLNQLDDSDQLRSSNGIQTHTINSLSDQENNEETIMNNYKQEKKKRDVLVKFYTYFLFERNIAFFFNFVIQKIMQMKNSGDLNLSQENYLKAIYLIGKNQMIHLQRINSQLNSKEHEKFEKVSWGNFQASQEYEKIQALLKQDFLHTQELYNEIKKTTQDILKNGSSTQDQKNKNFNQVLDDNFQATETFHIVYRGIIKDTIKEIQNSQQGEKNPQVCIVYLAICINPYDEFKNISYDFNKFYEETENMTQNEIQDKIKTLKY